MAWGRLHVSTGWVHGTCATGLPGELPFLADGSWGVEPPPRKSVSEKQRRRLLNQRQWLHFRALPGRWWVHHGAPCLVRPIANSSQSPDPLSKLHTDAGSLLHEAESKPEFKHEQDEAKQRRMANLVRR